MISASAGFKTKADDPQTVTEKKLVFNGVDRSTLIDNLGRISIRQYEGDDLAAMPLVVKVINDGAEFNAIFADKPGNFNKTGVVSLGIDAEYIDIYSGKLDGVELEIVDDRHRAMLTFTHKLQACIERSLGSSAYPLDYTAAAWNPGDLVWELLTNRGGLDATAGAGNPDIGYTDWLDYKSICAELGLLMRAYFTGESIAEALRLIGWLTDAVIIPDPTGKVLCKKFLPREGATPYLFTDATTGRIQAARRWANRSRVINKVKAWYGYDPATGTWAGSVTKENATSQTNYGLLGREADNTAVWHDTLVSATAWSERMVARYTDPADTVELRTKRGTQALLHQIGDIADVTLAKYGLSALGMQVYGLDHDPSGQDVTLTLEDLGVLNQNFFILDSATNGVLDSCVLF